MSKSVESTRRELFQHAVKRDWLESMICFQRKADGYADRDIDNAWWAFNAALDCVEIELPYSVEQKPYNHPNNAWNSAVKETKSKIETLNLGLKVK